MAERQQHDALQNQLRTLRLLKQHREKHGDSLALLADKWRQAGSDVTDALMALAPTTVYTDDGVPQTVTRRQILCSLGVDPVYLGITQDSDDE